ncbi:conserved Plasmodium protein, unknown function, partial [Plasmodium malariae]
LPQFIENYSKDVEKLNEMKKQKKLNAASKIIKKKNKLTPAKVQFAKQRSNISMNRVIKGASLDYKKLNTQTLKNKKAVNSILKKKTINKSIDKKKKIVELKNKNLPL